MMRGRPIVFQGQQVKVLPLLGRRSLGEASGSYNLVTKMMGSSL
jgi:hypothetical protein